MARRSSQRIDPITLLPIAPTIAATIDTGYQPPSDTPAPLTRASKSKPDRRQVFRGTLQSFANNLRGGVSTLVDLVRVAAETNLDAATFIARWDSHKDKIKRNNVGQVVEDTCRELQMDWTRLVGFAAEAAAKTGQHLAAINAALALPEVVERSIKFAKERKGVADRKFLFEHSRFVPIPAGSQVSIINQVAANAMSNNESSGAFVPFEADILEATPEVPDPSIEPSVDPRLVAVRPDDGEAESVEVELPMKVSDGA